jgi:hypothetical protein
MKSKLRTGGALFPQQMSAPSSATTTLSSFANRAYEFGKTNNALVILGTIFAIILMIFVIIYVVKKKKLESMWKDSIYIRDGIIVGDNKDTATPVGNIILMDNPDDYDGGSSISMFTYIHVNHIGQNIGQNRNICVMPFRGFKQSSSGIDYDGRKIDFSNNTYYSYKFDDIQKLEFTRETRTSTTPGYTYQLGLYPIIYTGLPDATSPTNGFTNNYFMRMYLSKFTNDVVVEVQVPTANLNSTVITRIPIRNIPIHTWFSVAAVIDDKVLSVYLDGAHYMSKLIEVPVGSPFGSIGHPVYLGQGLVPEKTAKLDELMPSNKDNARFHSFNGVLASFVISNRALTAEMIRNIHDTQLSDEAKNKAKTVAEPTCEDISEARNATSAS